MTFRVLSLGAGVQSTTVYAMAVEGELELDVAVFADTGWEPEAVYRHLEWMRATWSEQLPIAVVTAGDLREDLVAGTGPGHSRPSIPFYIRQVDGRAGMLRRQCTRHYKVDPVRRFIRENRAGRDVELVMGISLDEAVRMRDSDVRYIRNVYPLVDRRMSRHDCQVWLERHDWPLPTKSACVGCPYRDDRSWRAIRDSEPESWADAVAIDRAIRQLPKVIGETFLHRQLVPLDQADLSTPEDRGQLPMFAMECEGMCGV